jgi:hypothetical protein
VPTTGDPQHLAAVTSSQRCKPLRCQELEERSLQRRPSYQDVVDRVPRFVPRPPRKAKA